jgi:hypothetical protein
MLALINDSIISSFNPAYSINTGLTPVWSFGFFAGTGMIPFTLFYMFLVVFFVGMSRYVMGKKDAWYLSFIGFAILLCILLGTLEASMLDYGTASVMFLITIGSFFKFYNDIEHRFDIELRGK